jgi:hypothetical protein
MNARHIHASAVIIGEKALLILGKSGSGKSALADRLIHDAAVAGLFARLIGDDRIALRARHGRLLVSPHPAIAGLIERRGVGLMPLPFFPEAVLGGVIRLDPDPERLPSLGDQAIEMEGVRVPALVIRDDGDLVSKAHLALALMRA